MLMSISQDRRWVLALITSIINGMERLESAYIIIRRILVNRYLRMRIIVELQTKNTNTCLSKIGVPFWRRRSDWIFLWLLNLYDFVLNRRNILCLRQYNRQNKRKRYPEHTSFSSCAQLLQPITSFSLPMRPPAKNQQNLSLVSCNRRPSVNNSLSSHQRS